MTTTKTLEAVTAADLMQTEVITLEADAPVSEAFRTFEDDRISGAPVVDGSGKLVGFLSSRDLTRSEHVEGGHVQLQRGDGALADADDDDESPVPLRDDYSPDVLGRQLVADWMNPSVVSVEVTTPLVEVCRRMVDEHIHRVVVLDGGKIRGIVAAFDVVRYLAGTA